MTDEEFDSTMFERDVPVVIAFTGLFCSRCKAMKQSYYEIEKTMEGRARFVEICMDENHAVGDRFGVTDMPTLAIWINGDCKTVFNGFAPLAVLIDTIDLFC